METDENRPNKLLVGIATLFLIFVVGYNIYYAISHKVALSGKVRYTVGTTKGTKFGASGRFIFYEYTVNGKKHEDTDSYSYESQQLDGHYLVKFSVDEPEYNELYQNIRIPDGFPPPPPEGRKELPKQR